MVLTHLEACELARLAKEIQALPISPPKTGITGTNNHAQILKEVLLSLFKRQAS